MTKRSVVFAFFALALSTAQAVEPLEEPTVLTEAEQELVTIGKHMYASFEK